MENKIGLRFRDKLLPMIIFPAVVGVFTGVLIFLFKVTSSFVMHKSAELYAMARKEDIINRIVFVIIITCIGFVAAYLLRHAKECRGGGIPTAVASIRGLIPMKWAQGLFVLFFSSMLTYIAGVPLGNEGPSVQMGAAMGKGVTGIFGKKNRAWERYNMTGGACAGFAIATGAPLSGVIFAMEEAHRRFSPTIFMVASVSVISGTVTSGVLSGIFGVDTTFLHLSIDNVLPLRYLWVAALIGIVCGICANLFTKFYHYLRKDTKERVRKNKYLFEFYIVSVFVLTAVCGLFSEDMIGSGHSLIEKILEGHTTWYFLIFIFLVRAFVMIGANNHGVTGGLFVPTLAFGAMISSIIADVLISIGLIDGQYYAIFIVVGMASFLSSSSRIPLTALAFAAEVLCITGNMLPAVIGVVVAYIVAELIGKTAFTDTVIEAKTNDAHAGKTPVVVDSHMRVRQDAFAIGMELRDILWPPTCTVLSVHKNGSAAGHHAGRIAEGDLLHLHYLTYDPDETLEQLTLLLGEHDDYSARVRENKGDHLVPLD